MHSTLTDFTSKDIGVTKNKTEILLSFWGSLLSPLFFSLVLHIPILPNFCRIIHALC